MKMPTSCRVSVLLVMLSGISGCLIDDTGGGRGQSNAPSASVPDSGSPGRRESASEALREPAPEKSDETLDVKGRVNE